ncbi:hypothetical protein JQX13_02960 [Archangium violaceum]|uniref:hypothetical protein n=1 Tax=Archangium violaceum TaxID=83451 RepID=UPI00193C3160|nr:hypothetical protein [Archangium violaceum]QRK09135.1 hypothetical protein JQX13_02960 [Archangium violaceum]
MPSTSPEEKAARIAAALNGLGHIAMGHPLEWAHRFKGDAKPREEFHEDATIVFDMVSREESVKSKVIPNPAECKAALSRFQDMVRSIDFDDAASMLSLKEYARQALEAFLGEPFPE